MGRGPVGSAAGALPGVVGASVLISAYIHVQLWFEGMASTPIIGPLFLLNAVGGLIIGLAVLLWRHWLPLLAALGFGVLTLAAFWVSTTVGLFGLHEVATGVPQIAAQVTEIVTILGSVAALVGGPGRGMPRPARPRARRPAGRASA